MTSSDGRGFTLIEVMVSLAILALALTVLGEAQQAAMGQVMRAKMMTVATLLAREKMVDLEDDLFKDGFSDFEEEETGDFDDEKFPRYSWTLKIEKVEMPQSIDGKALGDAEADGTGGGGGMGEKGPASTGMGMLGGQMLGKQFEMFRNVIEAAIRRVSLKVAWKEGRRERAITVVGYFTDPRKIDAAAGFSSAPKTPAPKTPSPRTPSPRTPRTR